MTTTPTIDKPDLRAKSNFNSKDILGLWVSKTETKNGEKREIDNIHKLEFLADGKFVSFYKPNNRKKGSWKIQDGNIELYMKVVDSYHIRKLTDSILSCQLLFNLPDTVIIDYKKQKTLANTK
jgi:hypothetical protein